ncbi:TAAR3 protein, partial [Polypterus senegalus]|nr:TAAR3 protein [Polypterus senegalus]
MQDELFDHVEYFCSYPGNVSCSKAVRTPSASLLLYILAGVLVIVTFCGNLVVIISISHFNQLHTPTNLLILSLAVADFFVGVFIMPIIIIQSIETCWYFGKLFCYIYTFFIVLLTTVSMIHLAMIAIDRYIAICHPLTYSNKITVQIGATAVAAIWISSATYSGTMILSGGNTEGVIGVDPCPGDCALVFNSTWATIDLIFSFLLPVFIMVTLYSKIFLIAKRHAKTISTQQRSSLGKNTNISKNSERKAAKTLGIVVTVFILCQPGDLPWRRGHSYSVPQANDAPGYQYMVKLTCSTSTLALEPSPSVQPAAHEPRASHCPRLPVPDPSRSDWSVHRSTLYAHVFVVAKRQVSAISAQQRLFNQQRKNNISKKSERKAAKTLGIVISIFLSCWLPYYSYTVINQFFSLPPYLYNILTWIAYLNSGMNPIIYAFFYPWFRKSFRLLITLRICTTGSSLVNVFNEN